jgi:PIN domain nuclease of toxin-antitoxin system
VILLIDTQALIWFSTDDPQLSTVARQAIESPQNEPRVSPATFWEMGIKISTRKLTLPLPFREFMDRVVSGYALPIEPILPAHAEIVASLPFHHKDPFDRLLVAQSRASGFTIVSSDEMLDRYQVPRIW